MYLLNKQIIAFIVLFWLWVWFPLNELFSFYRSRNNKKSGLTPSTRNVSITEQCVETGVF